jgi:CRP-like cAMP-binding protein
MIRHNQELLAYISQISHSTSFISEKKLLQNERIIVQGENLSHLYFIKSGIVKCFITENNGKDYILEFLGEGEIIGELEIINNSQSLTNVETLTDIEVFKIPNQHFLELLKINWNLNYLILKELALRVTQTASRASYQQNYPVEYSILKLIYLFSVQPLKLSKQDLADYLGISVRSLNRTLLALQQKKIIEADSLSLIKTQTEIASLLYQYEQN